MWEVSVLHVKNLTPEESRFLARLARTTRDVTVMKRAAIVLHSSHGLSPPEIAPMVWWSEAWVRRVIKDWNRQGRDALFPDRAPLRDPAISNPVRRQLVSLALSNPRDHGLSAWSLERLRDVAIENGVVEAISAERLRQVLQDHAVYFEAVERGTGLKGPKGQGKVRGTHVRRDE